MKISHRRRGFVMFIAMTMIVVVVAAMLLVGQTFTLDAKRTLGRTIDAQLDQMLLAGVSSATTRLSGASAPPEAPWNIELPDSLAGDSKLVVTPAVPASPDEIKMTIQATFADRAAAQTVTFRRMNNAWKLTGAQLEK
jgi:hypothetical protein